MTYPQVIGECLVKNGWRLAVAEASACGRVNAQLTSVSGASRWYEEGRIVYSHAAKDRLGCNSQVFVEHGSVSPEAAIELARAVRAATGADVGVAETGICGPNGGTAEKPVGLVYIAVDIRGEVRVRRFNLAGDREGIQGRTALNAQEFLWEVLLERTEA